MIIPEMIDTVCFTLEKDDVSWDHNFLVETVKYIEQPVSIIDSETGEVRAISGWIDNLKVNLTPSKLKIVKGSLAKYYLGDNVQLMGRKEIQHAIEKLSNRLHLPLEKAQVNRLDIGLNLILRHPVKTYFCHLGECGRKQRLEQTNGIYYQSGNITMVFYDKIKEQKGNTIPSLFKGRNILRYEIRLLRGLDKIFNVPKVTVAMLYNEEFYMKFINIMHDYYLEIDKQNDIAIDFSEFTNAKTANEILMAFFIERNGGETAVLNSIKIAQKKRALTDKEAFNLRGRVKKATSVETGIYKLSDSMTELNRKVMEIVRFYR